MTETVDSKPGASSKGRLSLGLFWSAFRNHPYLFLGLVVLAAGVGAGVWAFMPLPKHTASVVFQMSGTAPRVIAASGDAQIDLNSYKQRQAGLIKRRLVLNNVRKRPEVANVALLQQQADPVDWLDRNILVDQRAGAEYLRVYIEGDQPDDMLAILKAVSAVYLAEVEQQEYGARNHQITILQEAIAAQQKELRERQGNIEKIARTLNYADPSTMVLFEALLRDELRGARRDWLEAENQLAQAKATGKVPVDAPKADAPKAEPMVIPAALLDDAVRREPAVQAAEAAVLATKQDLTKLEGQLQPGTVNAAVIRAQEAVKAAEVARDKLKTELRGRVETAYQDQRAAAEATVAAAATERVRELEGRMTVADQRVKEITQRLNTHNTMATELLKNQKDVAYQEKMLATMTEERAKLQVEERADKRVKQSDDPYVMAGVEGSRRLRNAGFAGGGLFLAGLVGLVGWEFSRKRVQRPDDLATALGVPLLGTLPPVGNAGVVARRELVEAIDSARTALLHRGPADSPRRTIVVTSGQPGEGKTSLSAHLAVSLARAGFRTLLVDGDVHRPAAHTLFNLPATPGLCELLRGETGTAAAIRTTAIPGLSVLPAGGWSLAARQAMVRDRWASLRVELESQFDYLVVDTAPLLLMTDTLLLAQSADGVILSALVGVSETVQSDLTCRRLSSLGVKVLGLVVAGDPSPLRRRHRYYLTANEVQDAEAPPIPLSKA